MVAARLDWQHDLVFEVEVCALLTSPAPGEPRTGCRREAARQWSRHRLAPAMVARPTVTRRRRIERSAGALVAEGVVD